jgi:hypothetical protein
MISTPESSFRYTQGVEGVQRPVIARTLCASSARNGGFKAEMRLKLPPFSISPDGRLRRAERPRAFLPITWSCCSVIWAPM